MAPEEVTNQDREARSGVSKLLEGQAVNSEALETHRSLSCSRTAIDEHDCVPMRLHLQKWWGPIRPQATVC